MCISEAVAQASGDDMVSDLGEDRRQREVPSRREKHWFEVDDLQLASPILVQVPARARVYLNCAGVRFY
jgi:hypothetical protein